jgi:hypothetical protein
VSDFLPLVPSSASRVSSILSDKTYPEDVDEDDFDLSRSWTEGERMPAEFEKGSLKALRLVHISTSPTRRTQDRVLGRKRKDVPPVSDQEEDVDHDAVIYRGETTVGEQPPAKIQKTEKKKGDGYPRKSSILNYFSHQII